jgi:plasmid recombination enzyme
MFKKEMSVSFHIGSKKNAIPNLKKLKAIFIHNLRKYQKSNNPDLDLSKSQYNVILKGTKNLIEDVKKLYKVEFDEAVYKYNEKQSREDRKILNYLSKIEEDKQKNIATEIILQIGDKEDWQNVDFKDKQKMEEVFKNSLEVLEEKGFKVANATLHLDETSPHLHVVGVPIGTDFKKGLEKQVSSKSVFSIGKLEILREKIEKTIIEDFNKVYNVNIEKKQEKGLIEEHLNITDYKKLKPAIDELVKLVDKNIALEQVKEEIKKKDNEKTNKEEELKTKGKEVAEAEEKVKEITEKNKKMETDLINNKNKLDNIQKEKAEKDREIELEFKNLFEKKQEIERKKKELEQKEKELEELEAKEKELENKKKELEEIRQNKENIDFLIAQELEKKKQIEKKKLELEKLQNSYKELEKQVADEKERMLKEIEAEKEEIKKSIDEEEARLKEKEKELQELKNNGAKVDEFIKQEREKTEKITNKEEVLKILDKRIEDLSKNIGERKQKIEEAEAEEETISKREKELKEKREERVLKTKEEMIDETIEYLEDYNINIDDKDYYFRKVPFFEEAFYDVKDKGYFIGYVTDFFKTVKSNLENYREEYKEILKDIKSEVFNGIREFNNYVRKEYFNLEIEEEKTFSTKEKGFEKEKVKDEIEEDEKDYFEY